MFLTYQYRLYPLRDQEEALRFQLGELKFLWNYATSERETAWASSRRRVTYGAQQAALTRWRNFDQDGLGRVACCVAQGCLQRLDRAYQAAFDRLDRGERPGFPRFRREVTSMTDPQGTAHLVRCENGTWRLHFPRVGEIPVELHRPPPAGRAKRCTIKREGDKWFALLLYELPDPPVPTRRVPLAPVGVDLGLTSLVTLSNGEKVGAPKFLRTAEKRLRRAQRRLARANPGSHRREKQRTRVAACHAKVRNQRKTFAHTLSASLARRFDLVAFEDLAISKMVHGRLAKAIHDAGWGMLRQFTSYKVAREVGRCVLVPANGTTQTCSKCGVRANPPLALSDRRFRCPNGHRSDRDVNAARNILQRGLDELRRSPAEVTPVESRPPPSRKRWRVYSRKREQPPLARAKGRCAPSGRTPTTPTLADLAEAFQAALRFVDCESSDGLKREAGES